MKYQIGDKVVIHTPEVDLFVLGKVIEANDHYFQVLLSDGGTDIEPQGSEVWEWVH
jgi:hypothetical protein